MNMYGADPTLMNWHTWADVANYIDNTLDISYTDNPTAWVDAMKELMKGYRFIHYHDDFTGKVTENIIDEALYDGIYGGIGEIHYDSRYPNGENVNNWYNGKTATSTGGTGYKSAPTAKSIITENSGGGTAVVTDQAIGVKDTGLINGVTAINIFNGLLQVYGLVHTGIKIANAQVWKDMSNYVYDSDFTEDTPVERVIEFLTTKLIDTVTDLTSNGDIRVSIPDSIAQKMYDFLSNHMIESQIPGVYAMFEGFDLVYNFYQKTLICDNPSYNFNRYLSVSNPTDTIPCLAFPLSDDLFKRHATDFVSQIVGSGFAISQSVGTAFIASMAGIMAYLKTRSTDAVDNATYCHVEMALNRGVNPPDKGTPVSLSEISAIITCCQNDRMPKLIEEDGIYYEVDMDLKPSYLPSLAPGYSYSNGDLVKYLCRGKTGEDENDYGYLVKMPAEDPTGDMGWWQVIVTYPANEQSLAYDHRTGQSYTNVLGCNGYPDYNYGTFGNDITDEVPKGLMARLYSNITYKGQGENYEPDDYLVTAGIRSKIDSSGNPEVHPNPNQTKEQRYPQMENKKQQANPQAVMVSGVPVVQNNITDYVAVSVPFGSENAKRSIEHGFNNDDDPESYRDDRSQENKLLGKVNTEDPVDGYNEDTNNAVNQYNGSRQDPFNYPQPSPTPLPEYPTEPPTDPEGETDPAPSPGTLPGVTASGMVSVYNPTKAEVVSFSGWLWTNSVIENLKKLLANPMDAIIGMHIMYATPDTGSPENIICGYLDSGVPAKVVTKQYIEISCGSVIVPEFYGTVLDYEPYTQIHIYLPFIGICALKANDVVGRKVTVKYGIDVLTGTVLAMINCKWGDSDIQSYTFPGNCAVQIPLTGGSYADIIRGISSMAVGVAGSVVTGSPLPGIAGVISGATGMSLDVSKSGSLGANAGVLGPRKPYIIVTRKKAYDAGNYNQFYGFPANKSVILGNCTGYTRVKSVHIETIPVATDNEKTEIETLLKQGVIIR